LLQIITEYQYYIMMLYTWLAVCTTGGCLFDDPIIHDTKA